MTIEGATPASEALRIIRRLDEQMESLNPALAALPSKFFSELLAADDDIKAHEIHLHRALLGEAELAGCAEYLGNVLQACMHCVGAYRLQGDRAWSAVLRAQQYAGVALAILVADEEVFHGRSESGKDGKTKQTDANAKLRAHVLGLAAKSTSTSARGVANNIVSRLLGKDDCNLLAALNEFGFTVAVDRKGPDGPKVSRDNLERTISDWIRAARKQATGSVHVGGGSGREAVKPSRRPRNSVR
jgi:hypothetical protein